MPGMLQIEAIDFADGAPETGIVAVEVQLAAG